MKKVNIGEVVVLLMDIKCIETPFFAKTGDMYKVRDINIDPMFPSGYSITIKGYGDEIKVDRSAVVHYDDWKNIKNAVITSALREALV